VPVARKNGKPAFCCSAKTETRKIFISATGLVGTKKRTRSSGKTFFLYYARFYERETFSVLYCGAQAFAISFALQEERITDVSQCETSIFRSFALL